MVLWTCLRNSIFHQSSPCGNCDTKLVKAIKDLLFIFFCPFATKSFHFYLIKLCNSSAANITRLHCSRMCTACALTVSPSMLGGGVTAPGGGCLLWGVSAPGGYLLLGGSAHRGSVCSWGVSAPRGVYPSMHWGRHPPVNRILDTRLWKYYLAPNFICGHKNAKVTCMQRQLMRK